MIVYREWFAQPKPGSLGKRERWSGWFLFGVIPLLVIQKSYLDPN